MYKRYDNSFNTFFNRHFNNHNLKNYDTINVLLNNQCFTCINYAAYTGKNNFLCTNIPINYFKSIPSENIFYTHKSELIALDSIDYSNAKFIFLNKKMIFLNKF